MINEKDANSVVSLVRSSQKKAEDIQEPEIRSMVREAVELAGGFDFIKDGQLVVIKPNIVTTRTTPGSLKPLMMPFSDPFKENVQIPALTNGVTTDRRVAKAVVELVREKNPSGQVYIMECAGDGRTSENFQRMGYTHENIPGVDKFIAIGENGGHKNIDLDNLVAVSVENQQYKKLPGHLKNKYYFDKTYYSADVVISLCCVKNHMNAAVTGGIKNVALGARPANLYAPKGKTISAFVIGHTWEPINKFIHDYYSAKPVEFVLADGLQGLSYGPSAQGAPSYEQAKMNMRLILASKDAVACDTVQSCIVGIDPEKVDYLRDLADEGFGTIDTAQITIAGNATVDQVKKSFPLPDGLLGYVLSKGAKKAVYNKFTPPDFFIESISNDGETVKIISNNSTDINKIELFKDDKLIKTFTDYFKILEVSLATINPALPGRLILNVYDRFLNCRRTEVNI